VCDMFTLFTFCRSVETLLFLFVSIMVIVQSINHHMCSKSMVDPVECLELIE
jgi:hypothetical protein